jgi:hypothetical protein
MEALSIPEAEIYFDKSFLAAEEATNLVGDPTGEVRVGVA